MHPAGAVKGFPLELCYVAQGMDGTNDKGFHSDLHLVENLKNRIKGRISVRGSKKERGVPASDKRHG